MEDPDEQRRQSRGGPRSPLAVLVGEWKAFTPAELVFVGVVAVGIVTLVAFRPGGTLQAVAIAIGAGLLAGAGVSLARRRSGRSG